MAQVKLVNITKTYEGNVKAVNSVNLDIQDEEFVVLVGPSGCGKSTTLRMIAGLEDISGGDLFIDGQRCNDQAPKDRDIAMVFQNYALYPHMSVYDNMAFGLKIRKVNKEEINRRVLEAAAILDIDTLLKRKPKALSGGQRQRVAVGRAIVRNPKVFLFDEPLSNLDAKLRVQMRSEIVALHHRLKATIIYVTHDQTEAMTMGSKIVVMQGGQIQQVGSPLELYNHPVNCFVATFIGTPPMNISKVTLAEQDGKLFATSPGLTLMVPVLMANIVRGTGRREVLIGLRAEALRLVDQPDPHNDIKAVITIIEPLGYETQLHVKTENDQWIIKASSEQSYTIGDEVHFRTDMSKVHFFDAENEQSLLYKGSYAQNL